MKFKLYEDCLNESHSSVLDDLIGLGFTEEQAMKAIEYFTPRLGNSELGSKIYSIKEITLLSVEEAEKVPKDILSIGTWWWLRSPGNDSLHTTTVNRDGSISTYGSSVEDKSICVRPALRISNIQSFNLKLYDRITIFDLHWIVVDRDLVLLDGVLGRHSYSHTSNDYESSQIKQYLENWLSNQKKKFGY